MPSPSASAAASSASSSTPAFSTYCQRRPSAGAVEKPVDNSRPRPPATGPAERPVTPWLRALRRYPHSVEITLLRDAHLCVENGECVGSYHIFTPPTVAARATIEATRFCTGISLRLGLTANWKLYPFRGRFQDLADHLCSESPDAVEARDASTGMGRPSCRRRWRYVRLAHTRGVHDQRAGRCSDPCADCPWSRAREHQALSRR